MTVLSGGILAVKVEQGAIGFRIQKDFQEDGGVFQLFYRYNPVHVQDSIYLCDFKRIDLPSGNYKIIGLHSHDKPLSEEQCKELVKTTTENAQGEDVGDMFYWDYVSECFGHVETASESLESWMRANKIYIVNPYEDKEEEDDGNFFGLVDAVIHREVQSRTGNWIFLKQIEV